MSEQNGSKQIKRRNPGHVGFFKVCEALRNHREDIEKTCTTRVDVAEYVSQKIDISISDGTIADALKATGIELKLLRVSGRGKESTESSANNRRVVLRAILRLHEELGIAPSQELVDYFFRTTGSPYRPPVPVTSVPPASAVSITKRG